MLWAGQCRGGSGMGKLLLFSWEIHGAAACLEHLGLVLFVQRSAQSGKSLLPCFVACLSGLAGWQEKIALVAVLDCLLALVLQS